jgi:hypothetical protein
VSGIPVLMIASVTLTHVTNQTRSRLPDLQPGDRFFSDPDYVPGLVSSGQATVAPPGTAPPKPLPRSVSGVPGLAAWTSNSSH